MATGLGPTSDACVEEVLAAMRDRVLADAPDAATGAALAANLDAPEVQRNLAPLADGIYRILTQRARPGADAETDPAFWQWVADLQAWAATMQAWQEGVAQAFASAGDVALRNALAAVPAPGPAPEKPPTSLAGAIA